MKKIFALVAIVMLVPFTAFGLQTMDNDAMDDTTGQAGISVGLDLGVDIGTMLISATDVDGDGVTDIDGNPGPDPGYIAGMITIGGIAIYHENDTALTIDIVPDGHMAAIQIGTGQLQIDVGNIVINLSDPVEDFGMNVYVMGVGVEIGDDSTIIMGAGELANGSIGLDIGLNIVVNSVEIGTVAIEDVDGLLAGDAATDPDTGFIGARDITIGDVTVGGDIMINVGTLAGYATTGMQIDLDLSVGVSNVSAVVAMGDDMTLANEMLHVGVGYEVAPGAYIMGVNVGVTGSVAIFAH